MKTLFQQYMYEYNAKHTQIASMETTSNKINAQLAIDTEVCLSMVQLWQELYMLQINRAGL